MTEPRDRFVDVLGLRIRCLEWGEACGEPLILVHGFLDQGRSWRPFVEALDRQTKKPLWIIAPDCRGHGDSDWVGAGGYYHFPDYIMDLDHVVQASNLAQFKLIGHSMGGTIAFQYAGTFPNRVTKLVLIEGTGPVGMNFANAPVRMEKWSAEVHERGRSHFREYASVEAGAQQLQRANPRLSQDVALYLARGGMVQRKNGKWMWKFDPLHRTTSPQPFYSAQAMEFLARIACPVLIVNGKESRHGQRPERAERLGALTNKQFAQIENAGHMVHQDNPDGLAKVVANFLFP